VASVRRPPEAEPPCGGEARYTHPADSLPPGVSWRCPRLFGRAVVGGCFRPLIAGALERAVDSGAGDVEEFGELGGRVLPVAMQRDEMRLLPRAELGLFTAYDRNGNERASSLAF